MVVKKEPEKKKCSVIWTSEVVMCVDYDLVMSAHRTVSAVGPVSDSQHYAEHGRSLTSVHTRLVGRGLTSPSDWFRSIRQFVGEFTDSNGYESRDFRPFLLVFRSRFWFELSNPIYVDIWKKVGSLLWAVGKLPGADVRNAASGYGGGRACWPPGENRICAR